MIQDRQLLPRRALSAARRGEPLCAIGASCEVLAERRMGALAVKQRSKVALS
jgi:hypothetical protein